jgi:hypothetical protein
MKIYYHEFHRLFKANVVEVCEGEGTKEDPAHLVYYVYTENLNLVGKIDELKTDEQVTDWTRNPLVK